jgi:outer membrane protein OmpA-like peptidoglycan-associated protein
LDHAFSFSRGHRVIIEEFIEKKHPYLIGGDIFVVDGKVVLWGLLNCHRDPKANPLVPVGKSYPAELDAVDMSEVKSTLQKMVDKQQVSPQAAAVITDWLKENQPAEVQEIGDIRNHADGTKTYRYRVTTANGENDLLLDIITDKAGQNPFIATAATTPSDKTMLSASSDSMTVAEGFIQAVREGDMAKARAMVNNKTVSAATLAGLCMIFEEGTFVLSSKTPIRNTVLNPKAAMYLVYVVPSDNPDAPKIEANHIAMTLARVEDAWQITGVGTDRLLDIYLTGAQKEGGRYFPIVKNPKGGESLALYFDFDDANLTPRSERQLQIVADILRESKGKLDIAGHTDDLGTEEYNLKLSERRAESVRQVLIKFGVAPEQITTKGLGKNEPRQLLSETDDEDQMDFKRGENRRAEIYLDFES